jgi:hypothetical protein
MMSIITRIPKRALYFVAAASLCVIAVSAFRLATRASATSDPFQGISAAENAPVLASTAPVLAQMRAVSSGNVGLRGAILSAARQLPLTIAGHAAYVLPTTTGGGGFCLFVEQLPEACDAPLSDSTAPVLFVDSDPDGDGPIGTTAFGIAEDGVDSVTMTVNGNPITVPVKGNIFAFSGDSSVTPGSITKVTANFHDGHSVTLG